jgi:hypothetical protein
MREAIGAPTGDAALGDREGDSAGWSMVVEALTRPYRVTLSMG